jgi:hypothetical protein
MTTQAFPSTEKKNELQRAFYKTWYVRFNDPATQKALWLRFTVLSSANGFRRVSEVWGLFFHRLPNKEVKKVAIKQSYPLENFLASGQANIRIGECELLPQQTRGTIQSKGQSIQWDLQFIEARENSVRFVPEFLSKTKLVKNSIITLCEETLFSGTVKINGETHTWREAPGMQGYMDGTKSSHSWVWGHCNTFLNEQGKQTPFIFEGFSTKAQLGPLLSPKLSSLYFFYNNENYHFNNLKNAIYVKTKNSLNEWDFQADQDDLSFRGHARAEHKDFAGLTYEDTNGSLLYCSNSELAEMTIHVYRRGKLEATFHAPGTAALEIVSREKNPYVPILI